MDGKELFRNRGTYLILASFVVLTIINGCSSGRGNGPISRLDYPVNASREEQIEHLMRAHIIHEGGLPVHSFLLYVENAPARIVIHQGAGTVGRDDTPIDEDYQYNVASITKMFVATIILQLEEEGELNLDDRASAYLKDVDYARFAEIHILDGETYADEITIAHLLQHRTGIGDIFIDTATRFNVNVLLHRKRQYSPARILDTFFRYGLNERPHFRPGDGYYYSDINYVLLGLIVEQITGDSLPDQIRERILAPLAMENTYFEFYEAPRGHGKRIDAYLGRINMTRYINTSYEWAGGGLVSTTRDMATFIQALFDLELFENEATLQRMLDNSANASDGETYAKGINVYTLEGETFYGHGGFYGSLLVYSPERGITLSANIGQATPPFDAEKVVAAILDIVKTR